MMDDPALGIWAMIAFWASAVGGIAIAVSWARSRGGNPASRDQLARSLKRRLEAGEIGQEEYEKKLAGLTKAR
jgi:putative membrane protein